MRRKLQKIKKIRIKNVKSKQRKNVSYVIWTYWPHPGRYPMGVGNYTSQKVKPNKCRYMAYSKQNKSLLGKVGKNPTCIGQTKGNTIRRGMNTIINQDNLIPF